MENPIKMDDLGVPLFSETSIYIYIYIFMEWRYLTGPVTRVKMCSLRKTECFCVKVRNRKKR